MSQSFVFTLPCHEVSAEVVSEFTEQELKDMAKVDKAMQKLVKTEKYKNGNLTTRKKLAKKMFKKLKSKGLIQGLLYEDKMFSFQYKNGVLGGMMLEEFDKYLN